MIKNFMVAKKQMTIEAIYSGDQLNSRSQARKKFKKPPVEGVRSLVHSGESVVSNKIRDKLEYANDIRKCKRSLEGVVACNGRSANQKEVIYISKAICNLRIKKTDVVLIQLNTVAHSNKIINFSNEICQTLICRKS